MPTTRHVCLYPQIISNKRQFLFHNNTYSIITFTTIGSEGGNGNDSENENDKAYEETRGIEQTFHDDL